MGIKCCKQCKSEILSKNKKFCNLSCSAKFNNKKRTVTTETRIKQSQALLLHNLYRHEDYDKNPNYCRYCGIKLPFGGNPDFCDSSCSSSFTNKGREHTSETKLKLSESLKRYYQNNPKTNNITEKKPDVYKFSKINCKLIFLQPIR